MYDPCGTQHLDGEEIIQRLAAYLQVDVRDLGHALSLIAEDRKFKMREG